MIRVVTRRPASLRVPLAFLIAVGGVVLAATLQVSGAGSRSNPNAPGFDSEADSPSLVNPAGPPIPFGRRATLEEAQDRAPFALYRPHGPLASDDSIEKLWLATEHLPQVAVDYSSGVRVYMSVSEFGGEPATTYRAISNETVGASVQYINAVPALVIQRTDDDPSSIDIVLNGVQVSIIGRGGQTAAELLPLALSLAPDAARPSA